MNSSEKVLTKEFKFCHVSAFFEKLATTSNKQKQDKIADTFFDSLKSYRKQFIEKNGTQNATFFPLMRLLLANDETERSYGMQVATLTKLFIQATGLGEKSVEAQSLIKCHQTEFPDLVYKVFKLRSNKESEITVFEVDAILNAISENKREKFIETELCRIITKSNALDMKWLAKIILRKLYLNYGKSKLLERYHPSAPELSKCNKLSRVCELVESDKTVAEMLISIEIFNPITAMLCARFDFKKLEELLTKEVYLDTKYDGERFQLHINDKEFRYFSRRGHDYSNSFGRSSAEGSLTPFLANQFKIPIHSIILDGEMMIYKKDEKKYHTKGEFEIDVKRIKNDNSDHRPCFCVYDVLYLNGVSQMKKPFAERLTLLKNLINDKEGVIKTCIPIKVQDTAHVIRLVNEAMARMEEGVVLKESLSIYSPGERNAGWYKIKPDYIDGVCVDFDLLLIGGFYFNKNTNRTLHKFMCGIVDKQDDGQYRVLAVSDVSTGLSFDEKKKLNDKLRNFAQDLPENEKTTIFSSGKIEWGNNKLDFWIPPEKSVIFEVKAAELFKNPDFLTSHSLRFPRISAVRRDKSWTEACSLTEFNALVNNVKDNQGNVKIAQRSVNIEDVSPSKKKRRRLEAAKPILVPELENLDEIEPIDNILQGRECCVLSSKEGLPSVKDLKILIKKRGGKTCEFPAAGKTYAIFVGKLNPQINRYIQNGNYNVAKVEWLISALSEETINKKCPKLTPTDMLAVNSDLQEVFTASYDAHGSSYFKETNESELTEILSRMDPNKLPDVSKEDEFEFWKEIGADSFHIFRGQEAIFLGNSDVLKIAENVFKIRGGFVRDSGKIGKETMMIGEPARSRDGKIHFNWVIDSTQQGKLLDTNQYLL